MLGPIETMTYAAARTERPRPGRAVSVSTFTPPSDHAEQIERTVRSQRMDEEPPDEPEMDSPSNAAAGPPTAPAARPGHGVRASPVLRSAQAAPYEGGMLGRQLRALHGHSARLAGDLRMLSGVMSGHSRTFR